MYLAVLAHNKSLHLCPNFCTKISKVLLYLDFDPKVKQFSFLQLKECLYFPFSFVEKWDLRKNDVLLDDKWHIKIKLNPGTM